MKSPVTCRKTRPTRQEFIHTPLTFVRELEKYINSLQSKLKKLEARPTMSPPASRDAAKEERKLKAAAQRKARKAANLFEKDRVVMCWKGKYELEVTKSKSLQARLYTVFPKENASKEPTRIETHVTVKRNRRVRTSTWVRRSAKLKEVGIRIHGDKEGYECDLMHTITMTTGRIDAVLAMRKVQDRSQNGVELHVVDICNNNSLECRTTCHKPTPTQARTPPASREPEIQEGPGPPKPGPRDQAADRNWQRGVQPPLKGHRPDLQPGKK